RSAMEWAGLFEPPGHYVFDAHRVLKKPSAYKDAPLFGVVRRNVDILQEFTETLAKMKVGEFARSYLSDLSLISDQPSGIIEAVPAAFPLYRRFAHQSLQFLLV